MEIQLPYSTLPTHVVMTSDQRSQSDITWYGSVPAELTKPTDPRQSWPSQNPHYNIRYDWPQHSMHPQSTWLPRPSRYLNVQNNDWRPRSQNDDKASPWPVDNWELRPSNVSTTNQSNKSDLVPSSKSNDWQSEDRSSPWGQAENWELRSSNVSNSVQSDLSSPQNNNWRSHSPNINGSSHWQPVKNWELQSSPNISNPQLSDMIVPFQNKDWQLHSQNFNGSSSWQQVKTLQFQPPKLNLIQNDEWHSYSPNDDMSSPWKLPEGLEVRSLNVTSSMQSDIVTPSKRKSVQKGVSMIVKKPNIKVKSSVKHAFKDLNSLKIPLKEAVEDNAPHNAPLFIFTEEQATTSKSETFVKTNDLLNNASSSMVLTPPAQQTDASQSLHADFVTTAKRKRSQNKDLKSGENFNVKSNWKDVNNLKPSPSILVLKKPDVNKETSHKVEEKFVNNNDSAFMIREEQTIQACSDSQQIEEESRPAQADLDLRKVEEELKLVQFDLDLKVEELKPVQIDLNSKKVEEESKPVQVDLASPTKRSLSPKNSSKPGRKPGAKHNRKDQKSLITAQIKNSVRVTSRKGKEKVVDNAPVVRSTEEQASTSNGFESTSTNISLNGRAGSSTDASRIQSMPMTKAAESLFNFYQSLKPPSPELTREQMLRLGTYIFDELLSTSYARPFVNPEAEDAYYYRSIIKDLMDLNTAERKLWARCYSSPLDLYKDI
ncbi:16196_t:CDS:1, partial [Racocetra persica]